MEDTRTLREIYTTALDRSPKEIQEYIASGDLGRFIERMEKQFRLPKDVTTIATHEILMAVLHITDPEELAAAFEVDAHVPDELIDLLLTEVYENVFKPLRERMEKSGAIQPAVPVKPADVPAPPPINRLTPAEKPPIPSTAPAAPVLPTPVPAAPPLKKPFGADVTALLVKSETPAPLPPLAPTTPPAKTRPGESSGSLPPVHAPSTSRVDPYREAPE